jgi:hypothetical protein
VNQVFKAALGVNDPWYISRIELKPEDPSLKIRVEFMVGTRFAVPGIPGKHPVDDMVRKVYEGMECGHLDCEVEVYIPRVLTPDGDVHEVTPSWLDELPLYELEDDDEDEDDDDDDEDA